MDWTCEMYNDTYCSGPNVDVGHSVIQEMELDRDAQRITWLDMISFVTPSPLRKQSIEMSLSVCLSTHI